MTVLEARDGVGGRTLNAAIGGGKLVEMGGQWISPSHERITALGAEVRVGTFPTHLAGALDRITAPDGHTPAAT